jgi:hypothetical protein
MTPSFMTAWLAHPLALAVPVLADSPGTARFNGVAATALKRPAWARRAGIHRYIGPGRRRLLA